MDQLFEVSFSTLADCGKPLTRYVPWKETKNMSTDMLKVDMTIKTTHFTVVGAASVDDT